MWTTLRYNKPIHKLEKSLNKLLGQVFYYVFSKKKVEDPDQLIALSMLPYK